MHISLCCKRTNEVAGREGEGRKGGKEGRNSMEGEEKGGKEK